MNTNKIILLSEKKWHKALFNDFKKTMTNYNWILIDKRDDFNYGHLSQIKPTKIFIPHWSYIIPENIYQNFECVVFHMTDLPFGRGGSPLQNLIERGCKTTKISALKVEKGLDTGDIYLKKELDLSGTAQDIFNKSTDVIKTMIIEILTKNTQPKPQEGTAVIFKRRTPEMSNLNKIDSVEKIYDYIRMLDSEGYPHAFIENDYFKFEFTNAKIVKNKIIEANVRIIKK